jgi:hypothetical protein
MERWVWGGSRRRFRFPLPIESIEGGKRETGAEDRLGARRWLVADALASRGRETGVLLSTAGAAVLAGGRTADQRYGVRRGRRAWQGKMRAGEWLRPDSAVDAITVAGSSDAAGIDELCQDFGDVAAAHVRAVAQLAL